MNVTIVITGFGAKLHLEEFYQKTKATRGLLLISVPRKHNKEAFAEVSLPNTPHIFTDMEEEEVDRC